MALPYDGVAARNMDATTTTSDEVSVKDCSL